MIQKGIPNTTRGNQVISFIKKDEAKRLTAAQDVASLSEWFEEDPLGAHLGMVTEWNRRGHVKFPLIQDMLSNKQVIECNGRFTYDTPIYKDTGIYIENDLSSQLYAGVDGSTFLVALNKKFSKGDILTYDAEFGEQFIVTEDEEIKQKGTAFYHTVKLVTNDPMATFPVEYLKKGVQYFKITHGMDEFGTSFSQFDFSDSMSYMRSEFELGSMKGVEIWFTGKADKKTFKGGAVEAKNFIERLTKEAEQYKADFVVIADAAVDGTSKPKNLRLASILEWLMFRELEKLTVQALLYQRGGTVKDGNGVVKLNEGLVHQFRRGFRIQYGRPGGITKQDIQKAANYVYSINPYMDVEQRKLKFICGSKAFDNVLEIFSDEVNPQLERIGNLLGNQYLLPKPIITGTSNTDLTLMPIRFTNVYLKGIGQVEIIKDPSLDFQPMVDRYAKGMHEGGASHMTYSMMIWDVTSREYSNNMDFPKGTTLVENGDSGANIFLVKPYGSHVYSGKELGRYSSESAKDIVSSRKEIGQGYWSWAQLDVWVKDPMKIVMIELDPKARKGFN